MLTKILAYHLGLDGNMQQEDNIAVDIAMQGAGKWSQVPTCRNYP